MRMFFAVLAVLAATSIAAAQDVSDRPGTASTPPGTAQRTSGTSTFPLKLQNWGTWACLWPP
jgi:hypothetical protein